MANIQYSRFVCYHRIRTVAQQQGPIGIGECGGGALPDASEFNLEVQLQGKLDLSRIVGSIPSRANFSEGRIRARQEIGGAGDRNYAIPAESRRVEVRVVEDVEKL